MIMATSTIKGQEVKTATVSGSYISGTWSLKKVGNIVFMQIVNLASIPSGAFTLGGFIPEEFRPKAPSTFTLIYRGNTLKVLALSVGADGTISGYNYAGAYTSSIAFNQLISWPTV